MAESKEESKMESRRKSEEDLKAIEAAANESFEDAMAESSSDSEEDEMGLMDRIKEQIAEQQVQFIKAFVDYGPPYYVQEAKYELINECSESKQKIFTVHSLLMARYDPNLRDPEDLYYTAMHWCARNCHLMCMKMLHRAKANFNLLNEFGQSSLHMACITDHPPDKAKTQKKLVEYLLREDVGSDPNIIDKGGYSAIDYCCMNQNYDLIKILLKHGANVLRNNEILVAKRKDLLDHIDDPECYRILHLAIKKAEQKFEADETARKKARQEEAHRLKMARRQEELVQKKIKEWADKQDAANKAYKEKRRKDKADRIRKEMNTLATSGAVNRKGGYERDKNGKWHYQEKIFKLSTEVVYAESRASMKEFRKRNKRAVFNERWKEVTGGELEMEWRMSGAFDIEGLSDSEEVEDVEEEKSVFDENDEELQGMDLDDMMF